LIYLRLTCNVPKSDPFFSGSKLPKNVGGWVEGIEPVRLIDDPPCVFPINTNYLFNVKPLRLTN